MEISQVEHQREAEPLYEEHYAIALVRKNYATSTMALGGSEEW